MSGVYVRPPPHYFWKLPCEVWGEAMCPILVLGNRNLKQAKLQGHVQPRALATEMNSL